MRTWILAPVIAAMATALLPVGAAANDATPYSWGANNSGQVSSRLDAIRTTPFRASIPPEAAGQDVLGLASGSAHSCAYSVEGEVFCWGDNSGGQLGNGNSDVTTGSVRLVGLGPSVGRRVADVAAGSQHTCALTEAGRVWCWGRNFNGQVGDGTTQPRFRPVEATGNLVGLKVVQVTAGGAHTCALTDDGEVWCWGRNSEGQLGDGSKNAASSPVQVAGLPQGVTFTSIAAGEGFTCGTASDGGAYCWGRNSDGQLGDGGNTNRLSPIRVGCRRTRLCCRSPQVGVTPAPY